MQVILYALILLIAVFLPQAKAAAPYWSYDEDYTGQEDWGSMPEYKICRDGFAQSPVNIGSTKISDLPTLRFQYSMANAFIVTNEKSFIIKMSNAGNIKVGEESYILEQIELHSPSSHHIRSKHFPMEIHFMHKAKNGKQLIVAVFAQYGDENPVIKNILEAANAKTIETVRFDATALLSASSGYYAYSGSLPYPPCDEDVEWKIMKEPITISRLQLSAITHYIRRNTRLPQPLYMREVFETKD